MCIYFSFWQMGRGKWCLGAALVAASIEPFRKREVLVQLARHHFPFLYLCISEFIAKNSVFPGPILKTSGGAVLSCSVPSKYECLFF